MLSSRDATLWACVLLVIHILSLSILAFAPNILHNPQIPETEFLHTLKPVNFVVYVLYLARILPIVSSIGDFVDDIAVLGGLRVPVLDGDWTSERMLSICGELSGGVAGL
ncbi:hypothetical protein HS088_TW11G00820 [Tripterygium wilfordii]|uniref:Uncharacterized protein n=1 Tax=Tripterygium wilfordii TaxID=458696 RepID=A0A7J7D323_TRIWF|nr:hypothetical protein HS088_TW11G00820 [Tripterygium wilfordii]